MIPRLALLTLLLLPPAVASAQFPNNWPPPPEPLEVRLEWGVRVPLRDGLTAPVTIYRPAGQRAPLPVILMITPYEADAFHPTAMYFAKRGYVAVTADTRGRGHNDGEWKPFVDDGTLGYDLVEWLAKQPWSDGQVAMAGLSYLGFMQWTTLKEFAPHLASIVPTAAAYFSYTSLHPWNIFSTYAIQWLTGVSGRSVNQQLISDRDYWDRRIWEWYSNHLPFASLDSVIGNRTTELQTWIRHPAIDGYVEATAVRREDYPRINIPILTVAGYFDSEQRAALRHYRRHMQYGNATAKARHHLILGPWDHYATFWPRRDIGGLVFDSVSVLDIGTVHTQWYDWTLKGRARPDFLLNRVAYYLMGAEEWRYADDLASVTADMRSLRLSSPRGEPTSLARAGTLSPDTPDATDGPDRWVYDPLDTRPGARERRSTGGYVKPADSLELFDAGLVYQTAPLSEPLDLAGVPRLRLWLAMNVPDTDFSATLYEITSDGRAIFLTQQLQRARYREGLETERLMTPGAVTPFVLDDFEFFARRIPAGSRIRLVVAALNSLQYEKNYNAGGMVAFESGKDARTARVDLHHDARYPSGLELPIAAVSRTKLPPQP